MSDLLKQINKKYGEGKAMIGTEYRLHTPIIASTGSFALDIALGCGGLPQGRLLEYYGQPSGGKCLTKDTYILTANKGYKTIEEIFNENNIVPSTTIKTKEKEYELINENGEIEKTTHFTCNNKRKIFKIKTYSGIEIKSTENHPLKIITRQGNLVWRKTGSLTNNDYLVINRHPHFGNIKKNVDEMYALGCLIADGGFEKNRLSITNDDIYIKEFIENKFCKLFNFKEYKKYNNNENGSFCYFFNNSLMIDEFYKKYVYNIGVAKDKNISSYIRESDKDGLIGFIQGYMDCECSIDINKGLEVTSASYKLLYELKLLLLQFGIVSFLNKKIVKNYEHNEYWRLFIYGNDFVLYGEEIGFRTNQRKESFEKFIKNRENLNIETTNTNSIPYVNYILQDLYDSFETARQEDKIFSSYKGENPKANLTFYRLKKILNISPKNNHLTKYLQYLYDSYYFYDKIISVEEFGEEPTFDFAMKESHSFIANGIINHNTTLSLISGIECQKKGYKIAFVDLEGTFDRFWFENLGGDSEKLIYIKPDSGGEALDIIDMLIKSDEVSLVIVDSVSAMMTNAEKEADFDSAQMAQLARLLSSGLKKINHSVVNSKCTVVFINQTRAGIGNYGSPMTETGGNALKFYVSIKLNVSRGDVIGDKENPEGFMTKIEVKKNKCGPPLRKVVTNLYIGTNGKFGIDKNEEVIDVALFKNVIKRVKKDGVEYVESETGKSYKYKDMVVMGKDNFITTLLADKSMFEQLKNEIQNVFVQEDVPEEGSFNDEVNKDLAQQEEEQPKRRARKVKDE